MIGPFNEQSEEDGCRSIDARVQSLFLRVLRSELL